MGHARIQIQVIPEEHLPVDTQLVLSKSLAQRLGINSDTILLQYGTATVSTKISMSTNPSSLVRISSKVTAKLQLNDSIQINAQYDPQQLRLSLGPLLGILININTNQPSFGEMTRFFDECIKASQLNGIHTFIFAPENIALERQTIRGWTKLRGNWIETNHPLPHVIYNRINSRKVEETAPLQSQLEQMSKQYRIQIFNEKFLDKWEVHQLLEQDAHIAHMLPETRLFQRGSLIDMAKRHSMLFLKPVNGSLGSGIVRLIQTPNGIRYQSETTQGTHTFYTNSWKSMILRTLKRIGRQRYLIQQGLFLVRHMDRPIDFRILCQKNKHGQWSITSAVGRIAQAKQFVSNLAKGGTILKATHVLNGLIHTPKPTITELQETALMIARRFDELTPGHFAELGIDLALDRKGKIWLIEINSKPSKSDDSVIHSVAGIRPSVNKLVGYICYLTGTKRLNGLRKKKRPKRRRQSG